MLRRRADCYSDMGNGDAVVVISSETYKALG